MAKRMVNRVHMYKLKVTNGNCWLSQFCICLTRTLHECEYCVIMLHALMSDLNISVTLKLLSSVEFRDCCLVSMPATNYCDTLSLYY